MAPGSSSGLACSLANWSGLSISARMPCDGGVAGGLVAGHREQHEEHVELGLAQRVAVDLGAEQLGDDVVA